MAAGTGAPLQPRVELPGKRKSLLVGILGAAENWMNDERNKYDASIKCGRIFTNIKIKKIIIYIYIIHSGHLGRGIKKIMSIKKN